MNTGPVWCWLTDWFICCQLHSGSLSHFFLKTLTFGNLNESFVPRMLREIFLLSPMMMSLCGFVKENLLLSCWLSGDECGAPVLTFLLSSHDWAAQVVFTGLSLVNCDPVGPIRGQGHCWRNVAPQFFFLSCKGQMKLSVSSEYLDCTDKFTLKYVGNTHNRLSQSC